MKWASVFAALVLPLCILMLQCRVEAPEGSNGKGIGRSADDGNGFAEEKKYSNAVLEDHFEDNHVLIVLNKSASMNFRPYTPKDFAEIDGVRVRDLTQLTMEVVQEQLKAERTGNWDSLEERIILGMLVDVDKFRRILALELPVQSKENVLQTIKLLEQREDILYAGPDYFMEFCAHPYPLPSDYDKQSQAFYAVSLPAAWDIVPDAPIQVGVIDSGINASHPALSDRIDYDASRDFYSGDQNGLNGYPFTDSYPGTGHGTPVAGIIGANGTGVTGVCWDVKLVSLKVGGGQPYPIPTAARVISAVSYATSANISIVNFSGNLDTQQQGQLPNPFTPSHPDYWDLYHAIENYPGIFVCAAGNSGLDNDVTERFPSNWTKTNHPAYGELKNLITVGALGPTNNGIRDNSNKGYTTVDLFAPGTDIYTTTGSSGYGKFENTSAAAPFVAGVAALVKALHPGYYTGNVFSPGLPADELKTILLESVDNIGLICKSRGRLNAYNAVRNMRSNGTSINGRTILGSISIYIPNIGAIGKFHLFANGTWVITPRGIPSNPISDYPGILWNSVPVGITNYIANYVSTGYIFGTTAVLVPIIIDTGWRPSHAYYVYIYTFKIFGGGGIQYSCVFSTSAENLSFGDNIRPIKATGNGITIR